MWLGPLGKHILLTVPLVSPAVTGYLETHTVTIICLYTFGHWLTHNFVYIGNTLTLHVSSVVTRLTNFSNHDTFILYSQHLIIIHIGLVIAPRAHKDVANLDRRLRNIQLDDIIDMKRCGNWITLSINVGSVESAVTFSFPDSETSAYGHRNVVGSDGLGVGDDVVFADSGSHYGVQYRVSVDDVKVFFVLTSGFFRGSQSFWPAVPYTRWRPADQTWQRPARCQGFHPDSRLPLHRRGWGLAGFRTWWVQRSLWDQYRLVRGGVKPLFLKDLILTVLTECADEVLFDTELVFEELCTASTSDTLMCGEGESTTTAEHFET